jgi:hypothetical protein
VARQRGVRAHTAHDVATRRGVGLPDFQLAWFEKEKLQKVEYKCTK